MKEDVRLQAPKGTDTLPNTTGIQHFASGNWVVLAGRADEFVEHWNEFLRWTRDAAKGFRSAMLIKDVNDQQHFISVAAWESVEDLLAWRSLSGFAEKLAACRAVCQDFRGSNYELIATA